MPLTVITKTWSDIARSIAKYIYEFRAGNEVCGNTDELALDVYNDWLNQSGRLVADTDLALWCVSYIHTLLVMPFHRLDKAVALDNIL